MAHMATNGVDLELEMLGREIRAERIRRGWSRKDLAARTGISERQVGNIERGDRGQLAEVWQIANALGVSFAEITHRAERAAGAV